MLWSGCISRACWRPAYRLSLARTLLCAGRRGGDRVSRSNVVRATVLFFKEAHVVAWPEWTHAGVGVALFGGAVWLLAGLAQRLQKPRCAT